MLNEKGKIHRQVKKDRNTEIWKIQIQGEEREGFAANGGHKYFGGKRDYI